MKNIIVLGAGMVGSTIAIDLSNKHKITLTDFNQEALSKAEQKCNDLTIQLLDVTDKNTLQETIKKFDLVVCAVPGFLGFETLKSIIEAEMNVIDISFFSENSLALDALAKEKNITAIVDCGVAPGMDNVILGYYNEKMKLPTVEQCLLDFERTKVYWLNWCNKTPHYTNYNEVILRSAMTLKLLSFDKTGAILAAATTSLPESIGEVRNWDYRFSWIRDSSMVIRVISKLGHRKIVKDFIDYIIDLVPEKDEKFQIMYGINKEKVLTEKVLSHLSGYENSAPVRIGNAAYR